VKDRLNRRSLDDAGSAPSASGASDFGTGTQRRFLRSGALAGVVSAFGFALIHALLISDIWSTLIIMMIAGAVCGLCVGWTFQRVTQRPSIGDWLRYNSVYLVMFGLLGAASVIAFDPVTSVASIMDAGGPIGDLIVRALPMTVAFTLVTGGLISLLFGRNWSDAGAIMLTTTVLVLFLGLNISAIGLVEFDAGSTILVVELFGLVVVIDAVYATTFALLVLVTGDRDIADQA